MQRTPTHRPASTDSIAPVAQFGTNARDVAVCRVCGRTLLMGERSIGFFTTHGEGPFDVCELCVPQASRFGLRPHPSTPDEVSRSRRRRRSGVNAWFNRLRSSALLRRREGVTPDLGTAPVGAAALPVALASFNQSSHARTLAGLHKTLGAPRASVVPRSPTDREVILTVAWEIVWYQFRIKPDGDIEQDRGTYLSDLPARWRAWNCAVSPSGKVAESGSLDTPVDATGPESDHEETLQ